MRFVEQRDVPLAAIKVGQRLRKLDPAWVEVLAASIGSEGQKEEIGCWEKNGSGLKLSFGAHRLAAVEKLRKKTIRCNIFEPETDNPELEARLDEIVENVARRELSALDRATNLAELKRIYETLHPATKRGGDRRSEARKNQTDKMSVWSFAEDAAEKTGLSPRHIRRAVELHSRLTHEAREALRDHPIADNASQLRTLSKLAPDLQSRVAKKIESGKARNVSAALAVIDGKVARPNPDHAYFTALLKLWQRAPAKARRRFLAEIGASIKGGGT